MEISPQTQKAGDNAQQIQAGTVIINNGITEARVREVFSELIVQALEKYTAEAHETAYERIKKFEVSFFEVLKKFEDDLSFLRDPAFQKILRDAQIEAATTEREEDYELLSRLLENVIKSKEDRKEKLWTKKALEITALIDSRAMSVLTLFYIVRYCVPTSGNTSSGLNALNLFFEKYIPETIPHGAEWLDHLDTLGTLRLSSIGSFRKFVDFYSDILDGYICTGIEVGSTDYANALKIMYENNIPISYLTPNLLLQTHVRINVRSKNDIDVLPLDNQTKDSLKKMFDMYSKDGQLIKQVKENFLKILKTFKNLSQVQEWWDNLPCSFELTGAGKLLAYTNARKIDPNTPKVY